MSPNEKLANCAQCSRFVSIQKQDGSLDPRCLKLGMKTRLVEYVQTENPCPAEAWSASVQRRPTKQRRLLGKIFSYAKAKLGPAASDAVAEARLKQCMTGECGYLVRKADGRLFCGGCGCGEREKAELHNKVKYLLAECPTKPSFWEEI